MDGFGTSLCWWAGQVGTWSDAKRKEILDLVFGKDGLGLNIVRFNIGGGENPQCKFGAGHMFEARNMPGYASAITGQDAANHNLIQFQWTWDADAGQQKILKELVEGTKAGIYHVNHLEAFSNSPPWYMTFSQCASGHEDGNLENLRPDMYLPFADYLVQVVKWFKETQGITFTSLSPFNEPSSWWWKAGGSQEGCKVSVGAQQEILRLLYFRLRDLGLLETTLTCSDDNSITDSFNTFARRGGIQVPEGCVIERVNTHTYHGEDEAPAKRIELFESVYYRGRRLWMSEYSSSGNGPHHGTSMDGAIPLAKTIFHDIAYMGVNAWIIWQAVEGWKENFRIGQNWGAILAVYSDFPIGDQMFVKERTLCAKQYFVLKQYSHFIHEGYTILGVQGGEVIAAVGPNGKELVLVVNNLGDNEDSYTFDLSKFTFSSNTVEKYRSSDDEECAKQPDLQVANNSFTDTVPKRSVTTWRLPGAEYSFAQMGVNTPITPGMFGGAFPAVNNEWIQRQMARPDMLVGDLKVGVQDLGNQLKQGFGNFLSAFKK